MTSRTHIDLEQLYERRCGPNADYRRAVWGVLVSDFFSRFIVPDAAVLDLGCGYGDFINAVQARTRLAMDMNPEARDKLAADVRFFLQDGSEPWNGIAENSRLRNTSRVRDVSFTMMESIFVPGGAGNFTARF